MSDYRHAARDGGGSMTATDELRRMLDERGVEYTTDDGEHVKETCWSYMGELMAAFAEYDNGTTRFACDTWCFTPEQAIAATLGRGTCEMEYGGDITPNTAKMMGVYFCSECGSPTYNDCMPYYCMYCGKAVS